MHKLPTVGRGRSFLIDHPRGNKLPVMLEFGNQKPLWNWCLFHKQISFVHFKIDIFLITLHHLICMQFVCYYCESVERSLIYRDA